MNSLQNTELAATKSAGPLIVFEGGDRGHVTLGSDLVARLQSRATEQGATLASLLVSAWALLVARWAAQDDVAIDLEPVHVRTGTRRALEKARILTVSLADDPTFEVMLKRAGPVPNDDALSLKNPQTQTDLLLSLEAGAQPTATVICGRRGEAGTGPRMMEAWEHLLDGIAADPTQAVSRLQILTLAERKRVLRDFNNTAVLPGESLLLHELFEQQGASNPDRIALIEGSRRMDYGELNARANRLAHHLRRYGVGPDEIVAICTERSFETVIATLAVLKAGGAYLPLDPAYPAERLAFMLCDCSPRLLLTQAHLKGALPETSRVVEIDREWPTIAENPDTNLSSDEVGVSARSLAYVIYTSGSTGHPKGAMNEHRGMVNRILAQREIEAYSADDICCQKTSFSFVDAVFETLAPLCHGLPLVIVPPAAVANPRAMASLIAKERVTRLITVPSLAHVMLEDDAVMRDLEGLRTWTLSGEEVAADLLSKLSWRLPRCEFIDQYGSSEVSSDAACFRVREFRGPRVPVGRPIPNTRVYVLDRHGEPVPTGVPGEIHVAGVNVGRGYRNRAELSDERFIPDRFSGDPQGRMYRMGDLGRWRPDGLLECLGRVDRQVKIRGFRIELGEIEAQLLQHSSLREAAVVAREDSAGDITLVACVTLRELHVADMNELKRSLRSHLSAALPEYMVPASILVMERLPLTPNGKLDRRALHVVRFDDEADHPFEAPRGQLEGFVAEIWKELLSVRRVSRHDNFFERGGHSLRVMQLLERLRRAHLIAEVSDVYESATLAELASRLRPNTSHTLVVAPSRIPADAAEIRPDMLSLVELDENQIRKIIATVPGGAANIQDIYPLTPLQEGMLFHHLLDERAGDAYVETTLLSISCRERLEDLIAALQSVADRHDILRTAVLWEQLPRPVQVVLRQATLPVEEINIRWRPDPAAQLAEWSKPGGRRLVLQKAPLLKLEVAPGERAGEWYALLILHHMIDDDTSLRILISEVVAHMQGRGHELPEPVPYRNHVAQALAHAKQHDAEPFFRQRLSDIEEPTAPFGLQEIHGTDNRIETAVELLDGELVARTRAQACRRRVSVATLFHAAWALVVAQTSSRDDVVFGSVLLGRLQGSAGSQQTIGMFVNTLPLRLPLASASISDLIEQTNRELVNLLRFEQASLAAAQRCSGIEGGAPLFTAVLNYRQGTVRSKEEWSAARGVREIDSRYRTNYPISMSVDDCDSSIVLTAHTDRRVDPKRLTRYVQTALQSLVSALEANPEALALSLSILTDGERRQVIESFNPAPECNLEERLVTTLFEAAASRTPQAIAAVFEGESLTFDELNRQTNRLARHLRELGVAPDDRVGLCVERGLGLARGILGILKAGGAYLPLDPSYPQDRILRMVSSAGVKVLLTEERLAFRFGGTDVNLVSLDAVAPLLSGKSDADLALHETGLRPSHLAYVIYTSGSTGLPKGVMIEHRHVASLLQALTSLYALSSPCQNVAVNASFTFDASVKQIVQILSRKTIFFVPQEVRLDAHRLLAFLREQRIHCIDCTPSQLKTWVDAGLLERQDLALKIVLVGGEAIDAALWRVLSGCHHIDFFNVYGPTECTVDATFARVKGDYSDPHIGQPLPNKRIYILDPHGLPSPIGVRGEIHIGGAAIARGYLGDEQLTAQRFVRDPFVSEDGARMYRSGDIGRWREDGAVEYLGRGDGQVKVRGFRIELGEIEAQLRQHVNVKDVVVLARADESGTQRLVGYVAADVQDQREKATAAAASSEMVSQWKKVHDDTYSTGQSGPSFTGWNSSYTGEPIPEEEMREWLDCTVERILACNPRTVLEIGCGVGLVLQHVAPRCERYIGTDFAATALERLDRWLRGRHDLKHVELLHRSALELQDFPSGSFDTIVVNSVIQYFPDIEYLVAVLTEAARLLAPGGRAFIGDVRHLGLLPTFHSAVQLSRAAASVKAAQLKKRVARAIAQEKELVVDPQFFHEIAERVPEFSRAQICIKAGHAGNELTRYRYDVVLHTREGERAGSLSEALDWQQSVGSIAAFERALREKHWHAVWLRSVPNRRLSRELAAKRLIESGDPQVEASSLRRQLNAQQFEDVDPHSVFQLAAQHGYEAEIDWDESTGAACFDVRLIDRYRAPLVARPAPRVPGDGRTWSAYANDPLENSFRQQLIPHLREFLRASLPEYMIPSAWVVLKQLPLTLSGKIDRRALPDPEGRPQELGEYVAPQGDTERALAAIWAEVLQIDQVGVQDNFFDLGGHSILAMQVLVRVRSALSIDMPLSVIFEFPTLKQLAAQLDELRQERFLEQLAAGGADVDELMERVLCMPEGQVQALVHEMETGART